MEPAIHFLNLEYFYRKIYELIAAGDIFGLLVHLLVSLSLFLDRLRPYATVFSLLTLTGVVYCVVRIRQIQRAEREEFEAFVVKGAGEFPVERKWQRVVEHINSANPSDWRLAILEADILLTEMLEERGYRGETVGESLRQISAREHPVVEKAWEAHKVRNEIVHAGVEYTLTERAARRVISLYEEVFRAFRYLE